MEHPAPCTFPKTPPKIHPLFILIAFLVLSWLWCENWLFLMFWCDFHRHEPFSSISNRFGTSPHRVAMPNWPKPKNHDLLEIERCKVQGVPVECQNTKYTSETLQNIKKYRKTHSDHRFIGYLPKSWYPDVRNGSSARGGNEFDL